MASETSLSDLNIVYHSQILFDNVMLPLRIDIADITEIDYILAFSLTNPYKIKAVEQQLKEYNELEDIKTIYLTGDEMQMSYEQLQHQYELDVIEEDKKLDYCMKFINTTDKLFNGGY